MFSRHSAEIRITNNTERILYVKTMKIESSNSEKYGKVGIINADAAHTIYIKESGSYYLKIKAVHKNKKPVYSKGKQFRVYVGNDGHSILTISYSINESLPEAVSGKFISEEEFMSNSE